MGKPCEIKIVTPYPKRAMQTPPAGHHPEAPGAIGHMNAATETDLLAHVRHAAHSCFADARGSHDWEHTLRVHALCMRIGPQEGADMFVLQAAAYLHDIGRAAQDAVRGSLCHATHGAEIAKALLSPFAIDADRQANIIHCVRAHRFRDDHAPATVEARVLFDADKLDAIGAVGVARAYLFAGELGACLHNPGIVPEQTLSYSRDDTGYREFVVKLSKIKDRVLTTEGKRLALERHNFMIAFFERFIKEYEGMC
jgi:uncharacterized protein